MRLVQFEQFGRQYLGLELSENGDIINLNKVDSTIPCDMRTFLECGEDVWETARRSIKCCFYAVVYHLNIYC